METKLMNFPFLFGCSGPGAGQAIAEAIRYGYFAAIPTFFFLAAAALTHHGLHKKVVVASCFMLPLLIHPAWTVSARGGDCGMMKTMLSSGFVALAILLLVVSLLKAKFRGSSTK